MEQFFPASVVDCTLRCVLRLCKGLPWKGLAGLGANANLPGHVGWNNSELYTNRRPPKSSAFRGSGYLEHIFGHHYPLLCHPWTLGWTPKFLRRTAIFKLRLALPAARYHEYTSLDFLVQRKTTNTSQTKSSAVTGKRSFIDGWTTIDGGNE